MTLSFSDYVTQWCQEQPNRMLAVFKRSVELLADKLKTTRLEGGHTPKLTGNLIRSLLAAIDTMPNTNPDPKARFSGSDVGVVVASVLMGQSISLGFQAAYARRLNYGFVGEDALGRNYNQEGAGFVEAAALAWPICVAMAAEEIQGKVMGRSA